MIILRNQPYWTAGPGGSNGHLYYNMSGSLKPEHHIDFTGSTTETADSSSGTVQRIVWRTRLHHTEDNATIRRHVRGSTCCGAMSTTLPP